MNQRIFKLICFSLVILIARPSFSADDLSGELSLDDQFADPAVNPAPVDPTNVQNNLDPMDSFTAEPQPNLDSDMIANQDLSVSDSDPTMTNLASPIELRQKENALFGFSVGLLLSSQSYNGKYDVTGFNPHSIDLKTDAVQTAGFMLRYAIAPFYSLGTDINISYAKSQNHSSIIIRGSEQLSEITTLKGELNFTYAIDVGGTLPVYFFAGLGAEKVTGTEIERLLDRMGYGGQAGVGFAINSTLNLEGLYSYYVHRISQTIVTEETGLSTTPLVDGGKAKFINEGLMVRGSYSFNF